MRLLIDTQIVMWVATSSRPISARAWSLIADAEERRFSLVSIWEVAIKRGRYGPRFPYEAGSIRDGLLANTYRELPLDARHVLAVERLPPVHGDPFDRMIVAQAQVEGLTLLTADRALGAYGDDILVI